MRLWDFLFYAVFGLVVTTSVKMAGVLLVLILGCIASYRADLAPGATIVCTFGAVLLLALTIRRMRSLETPWSPGEVVAAGPDVVRSPRTSIPAASGTRVERSRRE